MIVTVQTTFQAHFLNANVCILIDMSQLFVLDGPIEDKTMFVQVQWPDSKNATRHYCTKMTRSMTQ